MGYQGFFEIFMITLIFSKKLWGYKIISHTVPKVHSFSKQYFARYSVYAIWQYLMQLIFNVTSAKSTTKSSQLKIVQNIVLKMIELYQLRKSKSEGTLTLTVKLWFCFDKLFNLWKKLNKKS